MNTLAIDKAIAKVPFLAESKNVKKIPLSGGITNLNFKIEADGRSYVIRLAGEGTDQLGIKRDVEFAANKAAGELGIAPEVVYFIEPEGYIVTRFVTGKRIMPEDIVKPDYLMRIAQKLRLFHRNAPKLKGNFNVFRRVEMLTKTAKGKGAHFPEDWDFIMKKMREAEKALLKDPYIPTPCHNDLLNLNWLDEEVAGDIGEIRLLDWEYAGMGDIFFDLGNFSHHHRLNEEQIRIFLTSYFGAFTAKHYARLRIMWAMSELHEAMWGTTQTVISKLEEDFQGYANLWFGRYRMHVTDFRWEQWLKDAGKKGK
ncbi:MAG TPA: choline/ethanolamine kinase family protein [Anaerolineales bacterium]|nr:choline/ethanolamine kinase family protein [Anaerolineales bacterium]HNN13481.1 choline/ethanolamine kinase family protein [Anaerolineales bacterium]